MEHLHKLKKDGKTVGYEHHIQEDLIKGKLIIIEHKMPYSEVWFDALEISRSDSQYEGDLGVLSNWIDHDEKCPFVTKDKNGKDVFKGDEVLVYRGKVNIGEGYVDFNERFLWWVVNNSNQDNDREAPQDWSQRTLCDVDIELIEDKENENNP